MFQLQNVFGLFGVDILIKTANGNILDDELLNKINNETIIVQKNNNSFENFTVQPKSSPITQ